MTFCNSLLVCTIHSVLAMLLRTRVLASMILLSARVLDCIKAPLS